MMHLVVRPASIADLDVAKRFCLPMGFDGLQVQEYWKLIWSSGAFGVVVHDLDPKPPAPVALIVSTYITDEAVERMANAKQGPAVFTLSEMASIGTNPFVDRADIGEANAKEGLNLFFCTVGNVAGDPEGERSSTLRAMAANALADRHGGNRHRMVLAEVWGRKRAEVAARMGLVLMNDYGASESASNDEAPFLLGIDREKGLQRENPWLTKLFTYFPPKFGFTEHQRQILLLAREGYTDNEIADLVGAKGDAIKKRWAGIYARVNEVFPELLPSTREKGRGQEKRRALLAHLRDRPEELRAYDRRAVFSARR